MYNEFGKKPKFTLVAVIAVAAVMLVASTTEMAITGYVFAYSGNQATGSANDCGNGETPTNIGCQKETYQTYKLNQQHLRLLLISYQSHDWFLVTF
ncbi:MAG: hypothetical protein ACRD8Z_19515 [Nitrososphaeraceae archaeon]